MNEPLVTIISMDAAASTPTGEGAFVDVHLKITNPPAGWISLFDKVWDQHFYMMKRRAYATTKHIIIRCVPSELQNSHIPELKKAIASTDEAYRSAVTAELESQTARATKEQSFKDDLNEIASNLKF